MGWGFEIAGQFERAFPQGLKPRVILLNLMYGLKPVPFRLKPVPFRLKPVPFPQLKTVPFNRTHTRHP
jgi:hypothetical protein